MIARALCFYFNLIINSIGAYIYSSWKSIFFPHDWMCRVNSDLVVVIKGPFIINQLD